MAGMSGNIYTGELAALWAECFRQSGGEDLELFARFIHEFGQPALEIGSGGGRLLLSLRKAGFDVEGVEPSAELVAVSKSRFLDADLEVTITQQSITELVSSRQYQTAFASRGVLQLLTKPEELSRGLHSIREVLLPGGYVAIAFVGFDDIQDRMSTDWLPLQPDVPYAVSRAAQAYLWRRISIVDDVEIVELAVAKPRINRIAEVRTKIYDLASARSALESHGFSIEAIEFPHRSANGALCHHDFLVVGRRT